MNIVASWVSALLLPFPCEKKSFKLCGASVYLTCEMGEPKVVAHAYIPSP